MKLNPTEVNIRASWSLNCAIASLGEFEHFGGDDGVELEEPKEMDEPDSDNYDRVGHGNLEL